MSQILDEKQFDQFATALHSGDTINSSVCKAFHQFASTLLKLRGNADTVAEMRPSTQVD